MAIDLGCQKVKQLKRRLFQLLIFSIAAFIALFAIHKPRQSSIVIGAKNNTEQHILGEILAQKLEREGISVQRRFNLEGSTICFNALRSGGIDTYVEYTGTALFDILKENALIANPLAFIRSELKKRYDVEVFDSVGFSNKYVLVTRADLDLKNISDIPSSANLSFDPEFNTRMEKQRLIEAYRSYDKIQLMDQVLMYFSLQNKAIDVISASSTDARLNQSEFRVLFDDRGAFPSYEAIPLARRKALNRFPVLQRILESMYNFVSQDDMIELNCEVETNKKSVDFVVREFLQRKQHGN